MSSDTKRAEQLLNECIGVMVACQGCNTVVWANDTGTYNLWCGISGLFNMMGMPCRLCGTRGTGFVGRAETTTATTSPAPIVTGSTHTTAGPPCERWLSMSAGLGTSRATIPGAPTRRSTPPSGARPKRRLPSHDRRRPHNQRTGV